MAVLKLEPDADWPGNAVDPYVRLAVALVETEEENHAALLGSGTTELELLLELDDGTDPALRKELQVPTAYPPKAKHVTGTLVLTGHPTKTVRQRVAELRGNVKRLKLAVRQQPHLMESLKDMGPGDPPWGQVGDAELDGRDSIIGIIDDGCAFAHRNFLKKQDGTQPGFKCRLLCLWDQTETPKKNSSWAHPEGFGYGWELKQDKLDDAIANVSLSGKIDERAIYEAIDYTAVEVGSHGTHVLDIAAGNGESVTASRGVAPAADIIFVQIPKTAIGHPADSVLSSNILDGIMYIFARASELQRPAVVNISYGGYGGPHDGSSLIERGIDELLLEQDNRAVVVSAGNGFNAQCHASGRILASEIYKPLTWIVGENDPTLNLLEIWYDKDAQLSVTLTPPNGSPLGPIALDGAVSIRQDGGLIVGWVFHRASESASNSNHVVIALRPTDRNKKGTKVAPAPAGPWEIHLANVGSTATDFHAWIERDDAGSRKAGIRLQSKFAAADSSPRCTLGSFATGKLAISVGAHNSATQEVCEYSACGPTRGDNRSKPDVSAPGEEDAAGEGILSVTALSSQPTRMNGTSASAPHVAGLVALIFQRANKKPLSAAKILEVLIQGAKKGMVKSIKPNSRWPEKNKDLVENCIGAGKVNAKEAIDYLSNYLSTQPHP